MINSKLAYIEPKSISKITTAFTLIGIIIAVILSITTIGVLVTTFPQLKEYVFKNTSLFIYLGIIIGILILILLTYVITYINALLYNYLLKYFTGAQFELTPHNELKEIEIMPTLSIYMILMAIWSIISGIFLFITFSTVMSLLSHVTSVFGSMDFGAIAASSLTIVTLSILVSLIAIGIITLIQLFIFNFYSRKNPLKLEIVEDNGLEIKSVDIASYVMSAGLTLLTIELIRTLMNIMVGGSMEVALLSIVSTIAVCIIYSMALPFIYNFLASRIGGIKFDIEPSNNMIQEYAITENLPEYNLQQ